MASCRRRWEERKNLDTVESTLNKYLRAITITADVSSRPFRRHFVMGLRQVSAILVAAGLLSGFRDFAHTV